MYSSKFLNSLFLQNSRLLLFMVLGLAGGSLSHCAKPIPKVLPGTLSNESNTEPLPYQLNVSGDIADYSYIFSAADWPRKEQYIWDAASELTEKFLGPAAVASPGASIRLFMEFEIKQASLTYSWTGQLAIRAVHGENNTTVFKTSSEAEYVFYRSTPDSSWATQYHIVFNTMALCLDRMYPQLLQLRDLIREFSTKEPSTNYQIVSASMMHPDTSEAASSTNYLDNDPHGFNQMSESALVQEYRCLKYISNDWRLKAFTRLNVHDKRKTLYEFWSNSFGGLSPHVRDDYLARVAYANHNFKGELKEGWETDRGRVLLIFGEPDQLEDFPSNSARKSYQIWYKNTEQGTIQFCFVDIRGTGELRLVHSTAKGEIRDPGWFELTNLQDGFATF